MSNDEKSKSAEGSTVAAAILWIIVFAKTSESAFETLGNSTKGGTQIDYWYESRP